MKLFRFAAGVAAGIALAVVVHAWVSPKPLDGAARWLRKATGTERSVGERLLNRLDEAGDALKGERSSSRAIRQAGGTLKKTAAEAVQEAREAAKGAAEGVHETLEKAADTIEQKGG